MNPIQGFLLLLVLVGLAESPARAAVVSDWIFEPLRPGIWAEMQGLLKDQNYKKVLTYAFSVVRDQRRTPAEVAEARLLSAAALNGLGLTYAGYMSWLRVVRDFPSSSQASYALVQISQSHAQNRYPDHEISGLINEGRQKDVPNEAQDMISFYFALGNMHKNFREWAKSDLKKIREDSYWGRRLKYYLALDLVKQNQLENALAELTGLLEDSKLEPILKRDVEWQVARLHFEAGNYDAAEKIYAKMNSPGRDFGRALLERAWIRYYQKDYSTALGMLRSLRAPFFDPSRTSEQYLLSMLIYRQLCHHSSVQDVADSFEAAFSTTFEKIKKDPLETIPLLMNAVLMRADILPSADLVYAIRQQRDLLKTATQWADQRDVAEYVRLYSTAEADTRRALERTFKQPLKEIANKLIETRDQVRLLKYVSGLEKFKLDRSPASRRYKAGYENPLNFSTLYWPTKSEFWWDETTKTKVLVQDRCFEVRQ